MLRVLVLMVAVVAATPLIAANAVIPETNSMLAGAAYIKSVQTADGAYSATDPGQNVDSVFAVRAAGYDPSKDLVGGKGPVDYLIAVAPSITVPAVAAKVALGVVALGKDPKAFGGVDLIAKANSAYDPGKGTYAKDDFSQAVVMVSLACSGNTVPPAATTALKANAIADGGGWGFGGFADPDTTAIAIQALLATGTTTSDARLAQALSYLKTSQGSDGGWGFDPAASNASSTAYVVQALIAAGINPEAADYKKGANTPVTFLLSQQNADGSFKGFDSLYSTNQVLPALAGRTFCNAPATPITRVRPAPTPTATAPQPTATAAPKPPATGNVRAEGSGISGTALAGLALVAIGSLACAYAARRR